MNVLVTGGAGYIGSQTVHALHAGGHRVVVLDTMEFGERAAIGDTQLIVGNVADTVLVERVLRAE